jgi:hypothetical protein
MRQNKETCVFNKNQQNTLFITYSNIFCVYCVFRILNTHDTPMHISCAHAYLMHILRKLFRILNTHDTPMHISCVSHAYLMRISCISCVNCVFRPLNMHDTVRYACAYLMRISCVSHAYLMRIMRKLKYAQICMKYA